MEKRKDNSKGIVIAFAVFAALFLSIVYASSLVFYQILKYSDESSQAVAQSSDNELLDEYLYMKNLEREIQKHWRPPLFKIGKKTVMIFVIKKDGSLESYSITKSSGDEQFDNAAIKAVEDTLPFPPLPDSPEYSKMAVPFTFQ